jgi:hypothetical protein
MSAEPGKIVGRIEVDTSTGAVKYKDASSLAAIPGSDARHKCRTCGKKITTYVPRGGDGSASVVRKHNDPATGKICNGAYRLV